MVDKIRLPSLDTLKNINDLFDQKPFDIGKITPFIPLDAPAPPMLIVRREDFLVLSFTFSGLVIKGKGTANPTLARSGQKGAFIFVLFPQQSIAEQAFYNAAGGAITPVAPPLADPAPPKTGNDPLEFPAAARLSGFSWFTFKIPDNITSIPFTLEALLAWEGWDFLAAPPDGLPTPTLGSAIEAPYRLLLSPQPDAIWQNAVAPVEHNGAVELWHTRLKRPVPGSNEPSAVPLPAKVRAAWARDLDLTGQSLFKTPFRTSLSPAQRTELVLLSSVAKDGFQPQPVLANKLMLSSLGAFLDLHGLWDDNYRTNLGDVLKKLNVNRSLSISEWRHLATLGRDHYVRVVQEGRLFPFGHRAALVTITERSFVALGDKGPFDVAPLLQQMFVVVREPSKKMAEEGTVESGELINSLLPFKWVHISNISTPTIEPPELSQIKSLGSAAFWIRANNDTFKFKLIGEDWAGHPCEFSLPLIFVSNALTGIKEVITAYNAAAAVVDLKERVSTQTFGRTIAFTEKSKGAATNDSSYETRSLSFKAFAAPSDARQQFRPALLKAQVRISAIEQMTGKVADSDIQYAPTYLKFGFGDVNKGEVFADLLNPSLLSFSGQAQKSGGVVTPNLTVGGLSAKFGVVAGTGPFFVDQLAKGTFNPATYFDLSSAKILGGISLDQILAKLEPTAFGSGMSTVGKSESGPLVPKLVNTPVFDSNGQTPIAYDTRLEWKPQLKDHSILLLSEAELQLKIHVRTSLQGGPTEASIVGSLTNFSIDFFDVIAVQFDSMTFSQRAGEKLDVDVTLPNLFLKFMGPLAFLNDLAALVDPAGFSDPPSLDIDSSGARIGYSLGLPPITIGAYALQNVTLGAALNIPFTDNPIRVRFNFSERHNPFLLTVSGFAGGGFLAIALGAEGIEGIEASLEFGGNLALSFGVASGGVCVMGGFYFASDKNALTFTAYVRAAGVLEVLSLISISTEFYLGLSYSKVGDSNRFWGQAMVTVEVEVAFFSKSVSMTMEREFAGGNNDPTFQQLMSRDHYKSYREAFAS